MIGRGERASLSLTSCLLASACACVPVYLCLMKMDGQRLLVCGQGMSNENDNSEGGPMHRKVGRWEGTEKLVASFRRNNDVGKNGIRAIKLAAH